MNSISIQKFLSVGGLFICLIFTIFIGIGTINSEPAHAAVDGWEAGRIIDDGIFTNNNTMSVSQIQTFLNSKVTNCDTWGSQPSEFGGGTRRQWAESRGYTAPFTCLRDYSTDVTSVSNICGGNTFTGGRKSAAQIIYDAAQTCRINPQVLIALLQKEQSLVTDTWPVSVQYRTATGYGCPDTAPCDSQYNGLANQVLWSARMFRAIMDASPNWYTPYVLGSNYIQYNPIASCGGSNVTIQNRATQALYNYTPYQPNQGALDSGWGTSNCGAYGNRNFYLYFRDWFGSTKGISYAWTSVSENAFLDDAMTVRANDTTNTINLYQGQKVRVQVKARNTGALTWTQNTIKLGTSNPNDRISPFSDSSWLSGNRAAFIKEPSVAPGEVGTFEFTLTAPQNLGTYKEYYRPIYDGVTWLNDIGMYFTVNVRFQLPEGARVGLSSSQTLAPGQILYSNDGRYSLHMQWDGNLVIYSQYRALWGSGTNGRAVGYVIMQDDGNLVMYDVNGKPIWASGTDGKGPSSIFMQTDGNLVIYSSTGKPSWGSGTNGRE